MPKSPRRESVNDDALNRDIKRSRQRRRENAIICEAAQIIWDRKQENPAKETVTILEGACVTVKVFFHEPIPPKVEATDVAS